MRDVLEDAVVGRVVIFQDYWRYKRALCLLIGTGSGPERESVRIVGRPKPGGGFVLNYIHSYDPNQGNGAKAYAFLRRKYGGMIEVREITSQAGLAFNMAMRTRGMVSKMEVDIPNHTADSELASGPSF